MAVNYYLELFPTEGNYDTYVKLFGKFQVERDNENAGVDLLCVKTQAVETGENATLLDLGVKARMTKFYFDYENGKRVERHEPCHFWLAPRSSIWKNGIRQANSLGVIDRSYRGVLMGAVLTNGPWAMQVKEGTRLFQILAPDMGHISRIDIKSLSELDETSRGEGGFGSTGR
jgi:dUTP pyrophosphatase